MNVPLIKVYLVFTRVVSDDTLEQTFILRFDHGFDEQLYDTSSTVFKTWSSLMINPVSTEEIKTLKNHNPKEIFTKNYFFLCDVYKMFPC